MTFRDLMMASRLTFAPEGEGAAAGAGDPPAAAGAGDPPAAAGAGAGDPPPAGGEAKWWEKPAFTEDQRQFLTVKGLTVDDQGEALQKLIGIGQNADKRFGKPLDSVIDKPKEGQALTDWMREQGDMFGLPKTLEDVKIKRPKDMPEGIAWDSDFETAAKTKAFELGLSGSQLQGMTELYAAKVQDLQKSADAAASAANATMMRDLQKDWGAQTEAKLALARQAAGVVAERAGLDTAALEAVSGVLTAKAGGDANTIKLFAALGAMMAEDNAIGLNAGGNLGMTPVEARAKAAQMRAPDGAYYKATVTGDRTELARLKPEMDRLDKIAVQR